jgi:serpin B
MINTDNYQLLYKQLADQKSNCLFSPYDLNRSLACLALATEGKTSAELRQFLVASPEEILGQRIFGDSQAELEEALGFWYKKDHAEYLATPSPLPLEAELSSIDPEKLEASAERINSWVDNKTRGLISNVVSADDLDWANLLLISTLYFQSKWAKRFSPGIGTLAFTATDGQQRDVEYIEDQRQCQYQESSDFTMITIPYEHQQFEFRILLPKVGAEEIIDQQWLAAIAAPKTGPELVKITLPKLDIFIKYLEFEKQLKAVEISQLSNTPNHDFTPLLKPPAFVEELEIRHFARLLVDVEKTEAAAATVTLMRGSTSPPGHYSQPKTFIADRPFFFALCHSESHQLLFVGKVNDPSVSENTVAGGL